MIAADRSDGIVRTDTSLEITDFPEFGMQRTSVTSTEATHPLGGGNVGAMGPKQAGTHQSRFAHGST
jgi:hypothetical protein